MEEMRNKGTGVAIPGLNSTQARSLTTVVPMSTVADAFDAIVKPMIARIMTACRQSQELSAVRDTLLPKLISGGMRMKDADQLVEEAV